MQSTNVLAYSTKNFTLNQRHFTTKIFVAGSQSFVDMFILLLLCMLCITMPNNNMPVTHLMYKQHGLRNFDGKLNDDLSR